MIQIILVRHGERERGDSDQDQPLLGLAAKQAEKLGKRLAELCEAPSLVLSSSHRHARQTAECIVQGMGLDGSMIRNTPALTPSPKASSAIHWVDDELYDDLQRAIAEGHSLIYFVGHETRLSQLILRFTGERRRPLGALEAACVRATDWKNLWLGCGSVAWRYPVRNWLEDDLVGKISSKMTIATFLASANFIGLLELLIGQRGVLTDPTSLWPLQCPADVAPDFCRYLLLFEPPFPAFLIFWAALIAQFVAAGLFIATVYFYDRLTMPSGFWLLKRPWWISPKDTEAQEKLLLHGPLQAHMVRIWSHVFTPAVLFSILGVILLVAATGVGVLLIASLLISFGVKEYFRRHRPTGEID
jgi:phosphohistidine phosphatase SixA